MGRLEGRTALVTGGGRGLGRAHAQYLAAQGANVVVNDLGSDLDGAGTDAKPAQIVVDAITQSGGHAVACQSDVGDWDQAGASVACAIETFGGLDILVNNAGILRDRTLAKMSESEWDAVIRVNLKGHAAPAHHAAAYWRAEAQAGRRRAASVIHTTSVAGFSGNHGQANYAAAKLAVVALSHTMAIEGRSFGMRSNAVSPAARTRISQDSVTPLSDPDAFDALNPANVSPLIGWLAEAGCTANAQVFHVFGDSLFVMAIPAVAARLSNRGLAWTAENLDAALAEALVDPIPSTHFFQEFQ
ncbi:SDR family NAD(P)-dependent oxidoreductase [Pararhodobacter sp.]|uniref:SDR family NAD(P)-dependent oxidoreductase n=1 Tax=Pararhodobacter sp. TaxID=2127056 RepID=UPI002AFFB7C9|nr:SDR family NAD(P)-dependent oxidoreductase [Pararhodobacter sp.]